MQFTVYEMQANITELEAEIGIECIPFDEHFFEEYKRIYNECFYEMRKSLDIKPFYFLSDYTQIRDKSKDIFLLMENDSLVGSVACYGNEVDDLFVDKKYQGRGIGRQLLLWAMRHIRNKNNVSLAVAPLNVVAKGDNTNLLRYRSQTCVAKGDNNLPIVLHVAAWNKKAVQLYESVGFTITKTEIIEK